MADDVVEIQDLISHWLVPRGHHVVGVSSGAEALQAMDRERFDLVIADVLMPDRDGLDILRELHDKQIDTRVLAISGGGKYMDAMTCIRIAQGMGAHAVLLKPFNELQLLEAMQRAQNSVY